MDVKQRTLKLNQHQRAELVSRLLELGTVEMVDVLQEVFETRVPDLESRTEQKFCLGIATIKPKFASQHLQDLRSKDGVWLKVVPYTDWKNYQATHEDFVIPEGFYESGRCPSCLIDLISSQRRAICPICGQSIWLT